MIGIIVALEKEAVAVLPLLKEKKEKTLAGKKIIEGRLFDKQVALIFSGIGKVSASLSAQALIDAYHPEFVLNFGSVGGVSKRVKIKNYYLVEKCMQFDFDVREIDDVPLGYIQDYGKVFFNTEKLTGLILKAYY